MQLFHVVNSNPSQLLLLTVVLSLIMSSSFHLANSAVNSNFNITLHPYHPFPDSIVHELNRRVNASLSRRLILAQERDQQYPLSTTTAAATTTVLPPPTTSCYTGNPIDDCWRCDPNWPNDRQRLADCGIGFGRTSLGGKGGPYYVVSDPSDDNPAIPKPGTLRHAVTQPGPVWIVFSSDMTINLQKPIIISSYKTIDGRGVRIGITGSGCLAIQYVSNVIIHNIHIFGCVAGESDGDGIHVFNSVNVWIDHCTLSNCADGLIDCTHRSTAITLSNNHFFNHDKVILLGHSDDFPEDKGMQVTVAFNRFGDGVVERLPRCRFGYFHVVNNDYRGWGIYAVGGSSNPTINSQGNRYYAPSNPNLKEVTRRMANSEGEWETWNWRTEGDMMVNGAFFVPSGHGFTNQYAYAMSLEPRSADAIDYITLNSGVLLPNANGEGTVLGLTAPATNNGGTSTTSGGYTPATAGSSSSGSNNGDAGNNNGANNDGYGTGMMPSQAPLASSHQRKSIFISLVIILIKIL